MLKVFLAVVALAINSIPVVVLRAAEPGPLEAEALKALGAGEFSRASDLLGKAAAGDRDPRLARMADLVKGFENQHQTFDAERRKKLAHGVSHG